MGKWFTVMAGKGCRWSEESDIINETEESDKFIAFAKGLVLNSEEEQLRESKEWDSRYGNRFETFSGDIDEAEEAAFDHKYGFQFEDFN